MNVPVDPAVIVTLIVVAGVLSQILADRFRVPAILLLLIVGFVAGPVTGVLDPDETFGDLLFPAVSLAVAIILFEGALTLRFSDIRGVEKVVIRLITVGVAVTVAVLAVTSHYVLGLPWALAILFGAIGCVSGPTVIVPMLRAVRPNERLSQILRWEGILIDPLGAVLAVIVFEAIVAGAAGGDSSDFAAFLYVLGAGSAVGLCAGLFLGFVLNRHLLPDYLKNVATLALVLFVFTLSNQLAHEAGLVAVTIMGMVLANSKGVQTSPILDFKEDLSILLISVLFVVLAARIDAEALVDLGVPLIVLLAVVLFLARPLAVFASTFGSRISFTEQVLLSWIAPRGIVAAAISALFAFRLEDAGIAGAEILVPLIFSVIVATVVLQSLTARPLARSLGVAEPESSGALIVGGNPVALSLAKALQDNGVKVLVADPSLEHVARARSLGLPTFYGNAVSEHADRVLDLVGLGMLMALSRRPALNDLACIRYRNEFGVANVYTVRLGLEGLDREAEESSAEYRGQLLFKPEMTLEHLTREIEQGGEIRFAQLTEDFDFQKLLETTGDSTPMLLSVSPDGEVKPFSEETVLRVSTDWKVGYLAKAGSEPILGAVDVP